MDPAVLSKQERSLGCELNKKSPGNSTIKDKSIQQSDQLFLHCPPPPQFLSTEQNLKTL